MSVGSLGIQWEPRSFFLSRLASSPEELCKERSDLVAGLLPMMVCI